MNLSAPWKKQTILPSSAWAGALGHDPARLLHRGAYRAVIAEAQADPALRATLHERFLATVEQRTFDRVSQAQHNGELVAEANLDYAAEVLCGTLYYRWLLTPRPIDEKAIDGLLDMFMAAYGVRG